MLSALTRMPGFSRWNFSTSSAGVLAGMSKWYHHRMVVGLCAQAGRIEGAASAAVPASLRKFLRCMRSVLPVGLVRVRTKFAPLLDAVPLEVVAIERDAVARLRRRVEVAVDDADRLGQRLEVAERAAVDVLEDVGVGQAAQDL